MSSSSQVDPQELIGERVLVETEKDWFIGTLKTCREYSLELEDWAPIYKFDDDKIIAHGSFGHYSKIIMHSGGAKELQSIKLCELTGDPFIRSDGAEDPLPLWLTESPKIDQTETPKSLHEIKKKWTEKKRKQGL